MDNLLEQLEQWNKNDEFSRCIEAIEAIPEKERGYKLTVLLGRAYSNLAVLGDHKAHGDDDEVDKELIQHSIDILETVWKQGENDPYWNARMGYAHLMADDISGGLPGTRRFIPWTAMTGSNTPRVCTSPAPRSSWIGKKCFSVCGTPSTPCRKSRAAGWTLT